MTAFHHVTRKSNIRKALELFVCFSILMSTAAFKSGDVIQTQTVLRGRSSASFVGSRNIKIRALPVGTVGRVLKVTTFRRTGNEGVQILLQGPRYEGLSEADRTVWVYNWTNRTNDIKACTDSSCAEEAPTMDTAAFARTERAQMSAQTAPDIQAVVEAPRTIQYQMDGETWTAAAPEGCVGCNEAATAGRPDDTYISGRVDETTVMPTQDISDAAAAVSNTGLGLTFSGGTPWIARCSNIISNSGEIGPFGRTLIEYMTKAKYNGRDGKNMFLHGNSMTAVCPRYNSLRTDSQRLGVWLVMWAALADQESDCTAQLPHHTSIKPGYGLFAAERYARNRDWRGEEYRGDITRPEKQIEVAVATMFDTTVVHGQSVNEGNSYWAPLRPGRGGYSRFITPAMRRIQECF